MAEELANQPVSVSTPKPLTIEEPSQVVSLSFPGAEWDQLLRDLKVALAVPTNEDAVARATEILSQLAGRRIFIRGDSGYEEVVIWSKLVSE